METVSVPVLTSRVPAAVNRGRRRRGRVGRGREADRERWRGARRAQVVSPRTSAVRSPQQPRSRDRARRRRVAVVLGGVLGLLPARAPAMPTIGWEAPAGCPSAERVVARIGEVVGRGRCPRP
ncbi:hypothetical protein [Nannocystis pusilla]|uniref:hypothetical protein n=1 Tax=Nannocystis pusilla TaxID=889268 RepID=UPI003B7DF44D